MSSDASKGRYDKALTELQVGLKVLPSGIAEAGAWRYAFIYEVLPRWLPNVSERARAITPTQARCNILAQYLCNVIACTLKDAARALGWPLAETRMTAEVLAAEGRAELEVKVKGLGELQLVVKNS